MDSPQLDAILSLLQGQRSANDELIQAEIARKEAEQERTAVMLRQQAIEEQKLAQEATWLAAEERRIQSLNTIQAQLEEVLVRLRAAQGEHGQLFSKLQVSEIILELVKILAMKVEDPKRIDALVRDLYGAIRHELNITNIGRDVRADTGDVILAGQTAQKR